MDGMNEWMEGWKKFDNGGTLQQMKMAMDDNRIWNSTRRCDGWNSCHRCMDWTTMEVVDAEWMVN